LAKAEGSGAGAVQLEEQKKRLADMKEAARQQG